MEIKAKKSLGQNFLVDKNIIKKIVDVANVIEKDHVLEIGPGTGNLTEIILEKNPSKIYVIEKDNKLAEILKKKYENRIVIINEDILKFSEHLICDEKLIVFGNLPYNISTQILAKWIINNHKIDWFKSLILMFQKEVADRIISEVNSKSYGRLSILSEWRLKIEKIIDINPSCFLPRPKVQSTLLKFTPKNDYFIFDNPKNLEKITRILFSNRRKMINKNFNKLFKGKKLIARKLKINLSKRPEELNFEMYYKIATEYEILFK